MYAQSIAFLLILVENFNKKASLWGSGFKKTDLKKVIKKSRKEK